MIWSYYCRQQQKQSFRQWIQTSSSSSSSSGGLLSDPWIRSVSLINDDHCDGMNILPIVNWCRKPVVIIGRLCLEWTFPALMANKKFPTMGTGFIVDKYTENNTNEPILMAVTNHHVVSGLPTVSLAMYWQNSLDYDLYGRVVYVEQHRDLALIEFSVTSDMFNKTKPLVPEPNRPADLGDPVLAIGHGQVDYNWSSGIIRSYGCTLRHINSQYDIPVEFESDGDQQFVQHSAPVVPGFSGGPLVDDSSQLVGVNDNANIIFNIFYNITAMDINEFVNRGKLYIKNNSRRQQQLIIPIEDRYRSVSGFKLGLIVEKNIKNNIFCIKGLLYKSKFKYINCNIHTVNGVQVTDIKQFNDSLIGTNNDNNNIDLVVWESIDQTYGQKSQLPSRLPVLNYSDTELLSLFGMPSAAVAAIAIQTYNNNNNNWLKHRQPSLRQWFHTSNSSIGLSSNGHSLMLRSVKTLMDNHHNRQQQAIGGDDMDFIEIFDNIKQSVFVCTQYSNNSTGSGTGFVVDNDGDCYHLIVTNYHVVRGSPMVLLEDYLCVFDYDNYPYDYCIVGRVVYVELDMDLALIEFEDWEQFPILPIVNYAIDFGDPVLTIGHGERDFNCHPGLVRAYGFRARDISDYYELFPEWFKYGDHELVEHSAVTTGGFSGGPMVNSDNQVVSANEIQVRRTNYYNIPANDINEFIQRGQQYLSSGLWLIPEDRYRVRSGLKLGLIIVKDFLENNNYYIVDEICKNYCRQLGDALTDSQINSLIKLKFLGGLSADLQVLDYTDQDLPIVF
ncbi:uncharacterized protein LOC128955147 [Oppia nitens]|uniref:uncharacterized protein LOC128955147 n=1 Tax=Oppia nitens TaxID=1686743 RepID=UPI0023DB8BE6|nr:uncharacterized protein LOC128955147 [Oppia nitens]